MTLTAANFVPFYLEIYGVEPFFWQKDLVERVLAEGLWPDLIDVPTGLGKTALIDIAVFITAATAQQVGAHRLGRRRVFFVVDRRIVVDEAYTRAQSLASALQVAPEGGVAHRVALGLRSLAPDVCQPLAVPPPRPRLLTDRDVLRVTRMRGGVTWDAAWLDRPDIPGVVIGTVDQVGSRLLFRGYGVSDRRKPIDAALVGMDSLVLVDEAHLAEAMTTTLHAAQQRDKGEIDVPKATVVQLTATPGRRSSRPYPFDVAAHRSSDVAWRRLNAAKRLSLVSSDTKRIVDTLASEAVRCVTDGLDTVMVVCNTVDRARQVHAALQKATSAKRGPLDAAVELLIGRSRPADRDILVQRLMARFGVGRQRANKHAAILVATQTVEVGANIDVDALITESAPWDALVQRLGRLNRLGDGPNDARAVVVHDDADSPVYGAARSMCWEALSELTGTSAIEVSPLACRALSERVPEAARSQHRDPPLLEVPTLNAWTRTAPVPSPDAPVSLYLHGLGDDMASVNIVWRDGLLVDDPMSDDTSHGDPEIDADMSMLPVLAAEQVEVPLYAARRWLAGEPSAPVSDLEGDNTSTGGERATSEGFEALAWRSNEVNVSSRSDRQVATGGWVWVDATDIRPGDVLVVPVERGGLDEYGWAPTSRARVLDVAEAVRFGPDAGLGAPRGRLRLDSLTGARLALSQEDRSRLAGCFTALKRDEPDGEEPIDLILVEAVRRVLAGPDAPENEERLAGTAWTAAALGRLGDWLPGTVVREVHAPSQSNGTGRFMLTAPLGRPAAIDRDDEQPECSSMGLVQVSLQAHHRNVGDRARQIAEALGLPGQLRDAVEAAARWHDLGKVDQRFQTMLCGGDSFEAMLLDEPLAKSGLDPTDRAAFWRARARSGLPPGVRHEAWSAAFVRQYLEGSTAAATIDTELVIHLVASHHGHARPWLPPVVDEHGTDITQTIDASPKGPDNMEITIHTGNTVDFEHPARFARLNDCYGRWGLALLESVVRCADMTVSEEGS